MKFFKLMKITLASMVFLSFTALHVEAKSKVLVGTMENADKEVTINFKDLTIDDFVKLVSNVLDKNILLQAPIPGKVEFISIKPVYKKDLPTILQSVLGSKGFSIIDRGTFLEVVRSKDAVKYNLPIVKSSGDNYIQMVTKIVPIQGVHVDLVIAKIKHLASASASITTIKESNSILITDFPKNIATLEKVIKNIENNEQKRTVFYKLKYAEVGHIFPALSAILKSRFDQRVETEKVTLAVDKLGNVLIVTGSPKNIRTTKQIIDQFDKEDARPIKDTAVISLKNTEVKDVLPIVAKLAQGKHRSNPATVPVVLAEPKSNAIVVSGLKEDIDEIRSIVEDLDKEQRQVYVKARIIEVSEDITRRLGVKYGLEAGRANSSGLYTVAMNMGGPTVALSSALSGSIKIPTLQSGLALGAALDFLTTNGAANVVSEPSILCLNNQESKIYVGQTQSVVTSSKTKDNTADLSTNTYSREDIGLTLKVKPRISNDGKVTLQAETKIEDVLPSSSPGLPTTTKREVTTRAIVKNGESVIVGGLIKDKTSNSVSKLPLLGDIPLVGEVFKHRTKTGDNINLVIVLTPYIVETSEDLSDLRRQLIELDNLQVQYSQHFMQELEKNGKKSIKKQKNDTDKPKSTYRTNPLLEFYGKDLK